MTEFILKYWMQVVFGLIAAGLGVTCKQIWSMYKSEKTHQKTEEQKEFYDGILNKIDEKFKPVEERLDEIEKQQTSLKGGLLSVQGSGFKRQCKVLLEKGHEITEVEWLQLEKDYNAYSDLGGNGHGHELFDAVQRKYYNVKSGK